MLLMPIDDCQLKQCDRCKLSLSNIQYLNVVLNSIVLEKNTLVLSILEIIICLETVYLISQHCFCLFYDVSLKQLQNLSLYKYVRMKRPKNRPHSLSGCFLSLSFFSCNIIIKWDIYSFTVNKVNILWHFIFHSLCYLHLRCQSRYRYM